MKKTNWVDQVISQVCEREERAYKADGLNWGHQDDYELVTKELQCMPRFTREEVFRNAFAL